MTRIPHCSFCGKNQNLVQKLIAAPGVYICDECVDLCCEILTEEGPENFRWMLKPEPAPKQFPSMNADWDTPSHIIQPYGDS